MNLAEAEALFGQMLDGDMVDDEIAATLVALADKGETADEIAGAALAMRARMIPVKVPAHAIDVCGTGGDGQHSLNISTAVAIVVAACGVPVAKHGNRAASSKAGAADTLEVLGLDLAKASAKAEMTLAEIGIASRLRTIGRIGKQAAIEHHAQVLSAIEARDADAARQAMRRHIVAAGEDMDLAALKTRKTK